MREHTFQDVVDCETVMQYGDVMLFIAKHSWLFTKEGRFIARLKQINRAWDVLFMSNNTIFMDGLGDRSYHYVSLETGEVLWSISQKGKRNFAPRKMALSPCGRKVYYVYSIGEQRYLDTIIPEDKICLTQRLPLMKGAVCAVFCTPDGKLGVLRSFMQTNTIHLFDPDNVLQECFVQEVINDHSAMPVAADDTHILMSDLQVIKWRENTAFSLLPEQESKISKDFFTIMDYDPVRQLLNIRYLKSSSTLIIDCKSKRIAAHYRPITSGLSGGCVVGDEFWIGTDKGIQKRPFPHMDPYPRNFLFFFRMKNG